MALANVHMMTHDDVAGVHTIGHTYMTTKGIDEKTGMIDVYALLPDCGDSIMVVNCGDHFEIRHHKWKVANAPPLELTELDIERLCENSIVWN